MIACVQRVSASAVSACQQSSRSCRSQASRIRHPHRRLLRRTLRTEGRPHTILHAVAPGGHDVTPHGGRKLPVQRTRFSC